MTRLFTVILLLLFLAGPGWSKKKKTAPVVKKKTTAVTKKKKSLKKTKVSNRKRIAQLMITALTHLAEKDTAKAIIALEEYTENKPKAWKQWELLGVCYLQEEDTVQALEALNTVANSKLKKGGPSNFHKNSALKAIFPIYQAQKDSTLIKRTLGKLAVLNPRKVEYRYSLGQIAYNDEKFKTALTHLTKANAIRKNYKDVPLMLGTIHYNNKKLLKALPFLNLAAKKHKKNVDIFRMRGKNPR